MSENEKQSENANSERIETPMPSIAELKVLLEKAIVAEKEVKEAAMREKVEKVLDYIAAVDASIDALSEACVQTGTDFSDAIAASKLDVGAHKKSGNALKYTPATKPILWLVDSHDGQTTIGHKDNFETFVVPEKQGFEQASPTAHKAAAKIAPYASEGQIRGLYNILRGITRKK